MEFYDKSRNQFQNTSQNNAVPASSNTSAVPANVFVDLFHEYANSGFVATVPESLQVFDPPPQEDVMHPSISLEQKLAQEVKQESCPEPWWNPHLRGSSLARTRCTIWLLR
jgi:hypothetical protein